MHTIVDALIRIIAPILPHTADEAWRYLHPQPDATVHLQLFPEPVAATVDSDWERLMALRDITFKSIEAARSQGGIDNPLEVGLVIRVDPDHRFVQRFDPVDLADLYGVSRARIQPLSEKVGYQVETVDLRADPRCERSWKRDGTVKQRRDGGWLSDRDAAAVGLS